MDFILMRLIFLIFSLFISSELLANSLYKCPRVNNSSIGTGKTCKQACSEFNSQYKSTPPVYMGASSTDCSIITTPCTGEDIYRSLTSSCVPQPPPFHSYDRNYPPPDSSGNCGAGTTKWSGGCVPDTAPPAPGSSGGRTRFQVPDVNGQPDIWSARYPLYGSDGGWRTYSGSDDYVPLSSGGGCSKFEGYSGWWCVFNTSFDGERNPDTGQLQPVVSPAGESQIPPSGSPSGSSSGSGSGGSVDGSGSGGSSGGGSTSTGSGTGAGTGTGDGAGTGTGTGTGGTPTPGTDTGSGSGSGTGTGTTPDPGTGPGTDTGGGGGTGTGTGSGTGSGSGTSPTPNPGSGSVTGGPCAVAFTCSGDPVMCATAREIHDYRCKFESINSLDSVPLTDFDKNNPFGTDEFKKKSEDALNKSGLFDFDIAKLWNENRKAYITFSGSCQPSISIDLFGRTMVFDISILCKLGDFIRLILHILAYMIVLRLIHRTLT